jgi:hypothetical protein
VKVDPGDLARLRRKLEAAARDLDPIERAVAECGEDLLDRALPLTPKAPGGGDLRASGNVRPGRDAAGPFVEVGFDEDYALPVHEMLGDDVNWSEPGTGPKFLENPWNENKRRYAEHIKRAAMRRLASG